MPIDSSSRSSSDSEVSLSYRLRYQLVEIAMSVSRRKSFFRVTLLVACLIGCGFWNHVTIERLLFLQPEMSAEPQGVAQTDEPGRERQETPTMESLPFLKTTDKLLDSRAGSQKATGHATYSSLEQPDIKDTRNDKAPVIIVSDLDQKPTPDGTTVLPPGEDDKSPKETSVARPTDLQQKDFGQNATGPVGDVTQTTTNKESASGATRITKVLLVSHFRGGSTLGGEMFNRNPDSFYWFEPLITIQTRWRHKLKIYGDIATVDSNDTLGPLPDEYVSDLSNTLIAIFNCDFDSLDESVLSHFFVTEWMTSVKIASYTECIKRKRKKPEQPISREYILECLPLLREACLASPMRAIKTIRIGMYMIPHILRKDPDIRVIYYVRDPRGMVLSRRGLVKTLELRNSGREACRRAVYDVISRADIEDRLGIPSLLIRYEDLCVHSAVTLDMVYTFLGLGPAPRDVHTWFQKNTNAAYNNGAMGTSRVNATDTAYHWMRDMSPETVDAVTEVCQEALEALHYPLSLA